MRLISFFGLVIFMSSCELLQFTGAVSAVSDQEIVKALKEVLRQGVDDKVSSLAVPGGFYTNPKVKIELPNDLKKVQNKLEVVGLGNLTDEGVKLLNSAAEDAVGHASAIFIEAIVGMSVQDAMGVLKGGDSAATSYLRERTNLELYQKFLPQISKSLEKVGANEVWKSIATKYNMIPFVQKVEPELDEYVTQQALDGVYKMIVEKEMEIRSQISSRNTDLIRRVFALQD